MSRAVLMKKMYLKYEVLQDRFSFYRFVLRRGEPYESGETG